jgi:anaerobic selenocysteine-containing dehydrogenase
MTALIPAERQDGLRIVRGACPHDCPDTCALLVTVEDGRAVRVEGDPEHPFTRGGLCVKVNDYVDHVYSPDRILRPLRRVGAKGAGRFQPVSWEEALEEIAERYRGIVAEHGPEAILPYSYLGTEGILNGLNVGDPFFHRLGATISERTFCDSGASTAYIMTVGPTAGIDPESFALSRYIILWAANVQSTNLHMWPFLQEAQRRGAKLVVIDPVRTRTAQAADWHLPIRPGTDAALALGLMHVIISEGHLDADYVERHTVGFPELVARVQEYPPERVAQITGIPAADIQTLAREYATTQPAAIRIGVAIERHASGGQAVRAITSLPALVGAWRRPGGGVLALPLWAFPVNWDVLHGSTLRRPGTRVLNQWRLGPALTGELGLDPPIAALFVYNSNPLVVAPEQHKIVAGLQRDDLFTVVSEQFLTDTARYADLVLPATTQLEQFDLMFSWGHLYVSLNQPAIAPLGEAVPNTELFRRLAARMGFDDEWFRLCDEEIAQRAMDWSAPALEGIDLDRLRREGWARLNVPPPHEYAPHAEGGFPTPSGKCELVASMAAGGDFVLPVFRQGSTEFQPGGTLDPLPHYTPADADGYPLSLLSPKPHAFLNSQYGNMRRQRRIQGDQTVVLHPDDAAARGIADGQRVRVRSAHGAFEATAALSTQVARGVATSSLGQWHQDGRSTVNAVTTPAYADMGRAPTFSDTRIEVTPLPN